MMAPLISTNIKLYYNSSSYSPYDISRLHSTTYYTQITRNHLDATLRINLSQLIQKRGKRLDEVIRNSNGSSEIEALDRELMNNEVYTLTLTFMMKNGGNSEGTDT